MPWFAIRSVYYCRQKADGTSVFEERIVCFESGSSDAAFEKAEREADEYAGRNGFELHPEQHGYEQDSDPLIDGYEVWSQMFESRRPLGEFYASRYSRYDYHPDV